MMAALKKLGVIEYCYRIVEFQFKDTSIITTGKHATTFLETHCDNCIDYTYTENDFINSLNLFSYRDDRKYMFLVREPLDRFLSGLFSDWKFYIRNTLKIFNVSITHQNILKSINEDFLYNLILNQNILINSHHCGNWLKFISYIKISKPIPKLDFINYKDRKNLFKTLGLENKPIINARNDEYKISYEDLSLDSKEIVNEYLKNEIRYYNYIFDKL